MNLQTRWDMLVIGGGIAGLTAAVRAGQSGLRVCVLEKGADESYLCNSRYTGGTLHVCLHDIMGEPEVLSAAIATATSGEASPLVAQAIALDGRRFVRWLQGMGTRFMKISPAAYHNWVLAPPRPVRPGLDWKGRGGDVLLRVLGKALEQQGGQLMRGARARELVMHAGVCRGVRVELASGTTVFEAAATVIADGGFQANADLVREFISPRPERLKQRGAGTGAGDGLMMARAAGARLRGMACFYGHVLAREAMDNDILWPVPVIDPLAAAGMVVNSEARRFVNEGEGGVYIANTIARQDDPLGAWALFDEAIWSGPGRNDFIPPNPHVPDCGGTLLSAPSLAELARQAGLPEANLLASVAAYNAAVQGGSTEKLQPPRRSDKIRPMPLVRPPFHAIPLCAGITYTMGGIAINEHGCVLDVHEAPIPGLYAAGSASGGVEGGPRVGYVGGLVKAGVLGLRSAEHAAKLQEAR